MGEIVPHNVNASDEETSSSQQRREGIKEKPSTKNALILKRINRTRRTRLKRRENFITPAYVPVFTTVTVKVTHSWEHCLVSYVGFYLCCSLPLTLWTEVSSVQNTLNTGIANPQSLFGQSIQRLVKMLHNIFASGPESSVPGHHNNISLTLVRR